MLRLEGVPPEMKLKVKGAIKLTLAPNSTSSVFSIKKSCPIESKWLSLISLMHTLSACACAKSITLSQIKGQPV